MNIYCTSVVPPTIIFELYELCFCSSQKKKNSKKYSGYGTRIGSVLLKAFRSHVVRSNDGVATRDAPVSETVKRPVEETTIKPQQIYTDDAINCCRKFKEKTLTD